MKILYGVQVEQNELRYELYVFTLARLRERYRIFRGPIRWRLFYPNTSIRFRYTEGTETQEARFSAPLHTTVNRGGYCDEEEPTWREDSDKTVLQHRRPILEAIEVSPAQPRVLLFL